MKKFLITITTFILVVCLFSFTNLNVHAKSGVGAVDTLVCNPGEDCSTQLRFNWKSSQEYTYFYYTVESDTDFAYAKKVKVHGTYDNTSFVNINSDTVTEVKVYIFTYNLDNLVPGTKYLYKVTTLQGDATSGVHNATTASLTGSFNFIWTSDSHLFCGSWATAGRTVRTQNLMKQANELSGGANLIIGSGDSVSYGSYYDDWLEWDESYAFTNFIFADSTGNHDYYSRATGSSKMTDLPYSWEANRNMPQNGISNYVEKGFYSTYYFLYNNCLFVSIDSIAASNGQLANQQAWFKEVIAQNQGKYQWIVVYEHFPWFDGETANEKEYTSCYNAWYKIFDEAGVDLALSGDSHVYVRSKELKDGKESTQGTVYMTAPQVGDRYRYITEYRNKDLIAKRIGSSTGDYGLQDYSGLSYICITPETLTLSLIDTSYTVKDTFTMQAKRELPEYILEQQEVQKEILVNSFEAICHHGSENESILFDSARAAYIKSISVKQGNDVVYSSSTIDSAKIDLGNLADDKVLEFNVTLTYTDDSTESFNIYGSTYEYFGKISNFNVSVKEGKTNFNWTTDFKTDLINKFEVYNGETLLGSSDTTSLVVDSLQNIDSIYTLKAYTKNNELIYTATTSYLLYGDINYDGSIDGSDINRISETLTGTKQLSNIEKEFGDLNGDGKVDFADAIIIMMYKDGKIASTYTNTYSVTFKDDAGKDIATIFANYGENATAPTPAAKDGYTFIGWSKSIENVSDNLIVYAIYEKNN